MIILFVNVNGCGNHFKETSKVCMTMESILPYIHELSNSYYKEEIILMKPHGHDYRGTWLKGWLCVHGIKWNKDS